ncbi:MAG: NAD-glutamate dehydrogenase [Alphaproteobacteria bacterium]|jgi:glutamate dehydrogenase|nr:NAD-glutamate dehydrogenase [Alphaproteobacteria bacterium]MBP7729260.1 NAD-glutamate dehydrogenase [Alphaproteobacteria bacterium]
MSERESTDEKQKQKILDHIAHMLQRQVPLTLQKSAQTFAECYYANVSLEDLTENSLNSLVTSVYEIWNFSFVRMPGQAKIRAYVKTREINDNSIPQTIVEIVNDNMPFLVDSVTGVINSLGYSIHLVIHPVMQVKRNTNHELIDVTQHNHENHETENYESFIHCEILEPLPPTKLKLLEQEVARTLDDVRVSVEDWMPMRKRLQSAIKELKKYPSPLAKDELEETLFFLEWIENNHFTFLGFCEYKVARGQPTIEQSLIPQEGLGILRDPLKQSMTHIFEGVELTPRNRQYIIESDPLIITKTTQPSLVHRRDPMDSITIKHFDEKGAVVGLYMFIGLFTSVAYNRSARDIPLLRRKVSRIIVRSGFSEQWHDGKTLIHILESFPRDELFQASEDWLYETCMAILQLQNRQRLTLFIRPDKFERYVSCLVYIPREGYDSALRRKIGDILERDLNGQMTNWHVQLGELAFARIHFTLKLLHKGSLSYDLQAIEDELIEASLTWRDHLYKALLMSLGEEKSTRLFERYGLGFKKGYQEKFTAEETIIDIFEIEQAFSQSRLRSRLNQIEGQDNSKLNFKIYSLEKPVSLSDVLPVLENMNLKVLTEIPFPVTLSDNRKVWIHDFEVQTREGDTAELERIREHFLEGFSRIWQEEVENDGFNRLIIRANYTWRECQLIRSYAKYIRQLQVTFSQVYMEEVLAKYPLICHLMIQLFTCQFSPDCKEERDRARDEILNRIKSLIESVDNLDEDRILSKFVNVIQSTLRTNYYQFSGNNPKPYISFKIDCSSIDEMPLPRPMYEIFVYSSRIEAIHLRGGKVARGGIRWSDRKEDFRTEILGLMKAQTVKNSVIVPVGSKGGFIVKRPPSREDKNTLREEVVACYQIMMYGLLDLTDNILEQKVIPPLDVVRWDDDDPYLVVAADKGTSTFSDYANQISVDYNFWLGDAFASGGSTGYDHKKMGITAKGAWESLKRHFREMGIDATREKITVVGIGDMSGDVFGNGMLLSHHLKLVSAFNHMHIFVDPSPNPEKSFQERKRLFDLPQSTWADYNPAFISRGGGVFDRNVKSIFVTPEMKALFDIKEDHLTPSGLIQYILKASVELLWFGGIGTFIKAKSETNIDVGDRVNDSLRINGIDVRAKVIVEGANLGITQLGRIEYAKNGGRLNTDAIDNSAGVDTSDHEVNIKILLNQAMVKTGLSLEKRNVLLQQMENDIARLVLEDNFWQNQVISLSRSQGLRLLDEQARLMRDLENEGLLNRSLENLPDEVEISRRMADKQGLTRPELAVLLAYAKLSLKQQLIQSELPDLEILQPRFFSYFPEHLQHVYKDEILAHPLRRDITATILTNSIVNRMGITFVHEMKRQLDVEGADVARSYLIVRDLLDLVSLWRDLESMETLPTTFQTELMLSIYESVKRFTDWFLRFKQENLDINGILNYFKEDFKIVCEALPSLFTIQQRQTYDEKCQKYEHLGISPSLSERLIALEPLISVPDMIILSKETNIEIQQVARIYFAIGQLLGLEWLRKTALSLAGETHWQQGAANAVVEDLYTNQRRLTKRILKSGKSLDHLLMEDGTLAPNVIHTSSIEPILLDLKNASTVDFAMLTVVNRQLQMLAQTV